MKRLATSAVAALLIAGCGGGGDDSPAPPPDPTLAVPDSASRSGTGLVEYLQRLIAADAETKEPLALDSFAPVAADDSEPEPVSQ